MENNRFESLYSLPEDCIKGPKRLDNLVYIRAGEEIKAVFSGRSIGYGSTGKRKYRMRMTGEIDLYYSWRNEEGGFSSLYQLIDDSLCHDVTHHSQYSLKLSSKGDDYPRKAYYKITWPPRVLIVKGYNESGWKFGIWCKKVQM